jgi:hypothetical protein
VVDSNSLGAPAAHLDKGEQLLAGGRERAEAGADVAQPLLDLHLSPSGRAPPRAPPLSGNGGEIYSAGGRWLGFGEGLAERRNESLAVVGEGSFGGDRRFWVGAAGGAFVGRDGNPICL